MSRPILPGLLLLFLTVGCTDPASKTLLVPEQPLGNSVPPPQRQAAYGTNAAVEQASRVDTAIRQKNGMPPLQATLEVAARVDSMGRRILATNPQIGMQPQFLAIGAAGLEIFHPDLSKVVITEGLVKQCTSDGQLAALLCVELGKMVSEREALAGPKTHAPEREPPMEVRVGSDNAFSAGAADQTYLAERWKFDRDRDRPRKTTASPSPALPPDPQGLANQYLTKTGFPPADLDAVAPLLKAASQNSAFEKQMNPPGPARPWAP